MNATDEGEDDDEEENESEEDDENLDLCGFTRLPCIAHTLQLVIRELSYTELHKHAVKGESSGPVYKDIFSCK